MSELSGTGDAESRTYFPELLPRIVERKKGRSSRFTSSYKSLIRALAQADSTDVIASQFLLVEEAGVPGENHCSLRVKLEDRKRISKKLWDLLGFEPTLSATEVYWLSALSLSHAGARLSNPGYKYLLCQTTANSGRVFQGAQLLISALMAHISIQQPSAVQPSSNVSNSPCLRDKKLPELRVEPATFRSLS